jgi:hypothetical protein
VGKVYEAIDDRLAAWIAQQPMFFVATAPLDADGHVNVSPKGLPGTFAIVGPRRVVYLDYVGSGAETIAHIEENGRIVVMFCAFDGAPQIVRLHGRGTVHLAGTSGFDELRPMLASKRHINVRSVIEVDVDRISDSCGFAVPFMTYDADRTLLDEWGDRRTPEEIADYVATRNAQSIDGLPAVGPS